MGCLQTGEGCAGWGAHQPRRPAAAHTSAPARHACCPSCVPPAAGPAPCGSLSSIGWWQLSQPDLADLRSFINKWSWLVGPHLGICLALNPCGGNNLFVGFKGFSSFVNFFVDCGHGDVSLQARPAASAARPAACNDTMPAPVRLSCGLPHAGPPHRLLLVLRHGHQPPRVALRGAASLGRGPGILAASRRHRCVFAIAAAAAGGCGGHPSAHVVLQRRSVVPAVPAGLPPCRCTAGWRKDVLSLSGTSATGSTFVQGELLGGPGVRGKNVLHMQGSKASTQQGVAAGL